MVRCLLLRCASPYFTQFWLGVAFLLSTSFTDVRSIVGPLQTASVFEQEWPAWHCGKQVYPISLHEQRLRLLHRDRYEQGTLLAVMKVEEV